MQDSKLLRSVEDSVDKVRIKPGKHQESAKSQNGKNDQDNQGDHPPAQTTAGMVAVVLMMLVSVMLMVVMLMMLVTAMLVVVMVLMMFGLRCGNKDRLGNGFGHRLRLGCGHSLRLGLRFGCGLRLGCRLKCRDGLGNRLRFGCGLRDRLRGRRRLGPGQNC